MRLIPFASIFDFRLVLAQRDFESYCKYIYILQRYSLAKESEDEADQSEEASKRNKAAAMAFRKLLPDLPLATQRQWKSMTDGNKTSRSQVTKWLMQHMRKVDGRWIFALNEKNGDVQKSRKSMSGQMDSNLERAVPRFIAVNQAGGEQQFFKALQNGEIVEVKSKKSGKPLYRWEEETMEVQHGSQTATALSVTGTAEIEVWNALYDSMDFQSLAPDSSCTAMGSMQGSDMGMQGGGMGMQGGGMGMQGGGMGMQGGGMGMQGGHPNQMNSFGMPAMGGVGGYMAPGQGFVGGAGSCQLPGFAMVSQQQSTAVEELPPALWTKLDQAGILAFSLTSSFLPFDATFFLHTHTYIFKLILQYVDQALSVAQNQLSESAGIITSLQPRALESSFHSDMLHKLKSAFSSVTQTFSHMQQAKVNRRNPFTNMPLNQKDAKNLLQAAFNQMKELLNVTNVGKNMIRGC